MPVDVAELGADFYAWTGHKAYGPTGIGVLHGRRELLEAMPPFLGGGHMIARVGDFESTWAEPPAKFEAGTMPVAEAIGLGAARRLARRDRHGRGARARPRRHRLRARAPERGARAGASTARPTPSSAARWSRFALDGIHPHDVAEILGRDGVCVRAGHHCAQPLMRRLGSPGLDARVDRGPQHARGRRPPDRRPRHGAGGVRLAMDDLYRENILEHYKRPASLGRAGGSGHRVLRHQPAVRRRAEGPVQARRRRQGRRRPFSGHGCAISQASASMASDELIGMPVEDLLKLERDFVLDLLGIDISATRLKCAMLIAQGHQVREPRPRGDVGRGRSRGLKFQAAGPDWRLSDRRGAAWASAAAGA